MDTKEILSELRSTLDGKNVFFSPKSMELGINFKPRKDDIFVATAPKCSTAWTLQMCHMLRSNRDTDFEDILLETPWDVIAYDINQDLDADQKYSPRVFKSHETYENIAKGGKYIFVKRNPYDAFVSFYYFTLQSPVVNPSTCSMSAFAKAWFEDPGMKKNPRESIEKIGRFMGLDKLPAEEFTLQ
eukprot:snap_masked-scaffold_3-processed-gene-2.36-mRNA-1 protein AED:1.00 eAED:1.00 QI:0/0/0/0/1/1/2/0/185